MYLGVVILACSLSSNLTHVNPSQTLWELHIAPWQIHWNDLYCKGERHR